MLESPISLKIELFEKGAGLVGLPRKGIFLNIIDFSLSLGPYILRWKRVEKVIIGKLLSKKYNYAHGSEILDQITANCP